MADLKLPKSVLSQLEDFRRDLELHGNPHPYSKKYRDLMWRFIYTVGYEDGKSRGKR